MGKKVVIVGAGYSGVLAAKKIAKKFKKDETVEITIIDRNPYHTLLTELHEVAANRVEESAIRVNLEKIFYGRNVNVVLDSVNEIDFNHQVVKGTNASYEYDYIVVAAGSKPTYFGVEGAKEHTYTLWSYDDAVRLRDRIHGVFVQASKEPDTKKRQFLLTFYVVGAGFTGVEMMGELAEYIPILCKQHNIDPQDVTMVEVDALSRAVTNLPEKLSNKVQNRLTKMGVKLMFDAKVTSISEDSITYEINGKKMVESVATVIWTAGIESETVTSASGEKLDAKERGGRIQTDAFLRAQGHENVFVAGDNVYYVAEGEECAVPQMVENAEQSAAIVAKNITELIRGGNALSAYEPKFHGMMVCIGGRWGTARVGTQNHMFNLWSFFAMAAKHLMNCVYFVQICGWNKVFSYLKHEFFTIRNKRSFVGGHLSNRTPSFMLFFLRIWLGAVWLFEGVKKVQEGWLSGEAKLETFFGGAQNWYNGLLGLATDAGSAATAAADAASTATGAATGAAAGEVLINWNFLGLFQMLFVTGKTLETSMLNDFAFKLNIPLMNWFIDNVILSGEGVQVFMQGMVVVLEIAIGVALLLGLFTTFFSAIAVGLQIMFMSSTGLYLHNVWMLFASIATLFAGTTLALDYWVMPKVKSWWSHLPFIRKWYFYHD